MGFLHQNLLKELKRTRKVKKNANMEEEAEETLVENAADQTLIENTEAEIEALVEEDDFMPGRTSSTKNRLQEFESLGMGQRSFAYNSPYSKRTNGVTARVQASQDNREKQKEYDLTGKTCVDCGKGFRNGDRLKSKVLKCTKCQGFVHENIKGCKVNLKRGNEENFGCKTCNQELESGDLVLKELLKSVDDFDHFIASFTFVKHNHNTGDNEAKMGQLLRTLCNTEEKSEQVEIMRRLWLLNVNDDIVKALVTIEIISKVRELEKKKGNLEVRAKLLLSKWEVENNALNNREAQSSRIETLVECEECGHKYSNHANLKRHMQTIHKKGKKNETGTLEPVEVENESSRIETQVECEECGNEYSNRANLKRHIQTIHKKRKVETETLEPRVRRVRHGN